ncbi:Protein of unknown function [Pyronema omphalodes CBS 100304]|uniref:Uncharacterized protein n=1 Tax=Pyronema omphalodes (strain CBS 100304) TaxID=1076935 RepID=U4L6R1_PYROM|nr:Protein of unknown function [Pyronema omphalodes CBS 100304]
MVMGGHDSRNPGLYGLRFEFMSITRLSSAYRCRIQQGKESCNYIADDNRAGGS